MVPRSNTHKAGCKSLKIMSAKEAAKQNQWPAQAVNDGAENLLETHLNDDLAIDTLAVCAAAAAAVEGAGRLLWLSRLTATCRSSFCQVPVCLQGHSCCTFPHNQALSC
jgi:hypothetical protein